MMHMMTCMSSGFPTDCTGARYDPEEDEGHVEPQAEDENTAKKKAKLAPAKPSQPTTPRSAHTPAPHPPLVARAHPERI